jgi:rhomboid protease GluP
VLSVLHPSQAARSQARVLRAMELAHAGRVNEASELFAERSALDTPMGRTARIQLLRLEGQWEELASLCKSQLSDSDFQHDPGLAVLYLRALGETGDREELFRVFRRFESLLEQPGRVALRDVAWLYLFAFGGRREQVEAMLRGRLSPYPLAIKRFWIATSDLAAGRESVARRELLALVQDPDRMVRLGAEQRLAQQHLIAPGGGQAWSQDAELLARLARELDQEDRYGMGTGARAAATMTYAFIGLNLAAFGLELAYGSSTDSEVLLALGALTAVAVQAGEAWRLVAFMFLHFGFFHLSMNMFALSLLGPFVEVSLGRVRFVIVYLLSGLSGGLYLVLSSPTAAVPLVGASGCIMGIVGATAAVLLRGYWREKARVASRRLLWVLLMIAIQVVFDLLTPQISFTAHAAGVVAGFVIASLMTHRASKRPSAHVPGSRAEAVRS